VMARLFDGVLRSARSQLLRAESPLAAEVWGSGLMAVWHNLPASPGDDPAISFAEALVRHAAELGTVEGVAVLSALAEPLLTIIAAMTRELAQLTKRVLDIARAEPVCRRLMGVPGVGPLTALAFRATIDRPDRFRRSRDVGAHLGLTPKRYQSGETDVQGGISRCGDELARTALYEAAHSLLVRSRKWSTLRAWGMQVAKRRGMARARVAVARKLAVVLHRVWADGAEFRWGKEDADVAPAAPA